MSLTARSTGFVVKGDSIFGKLNDLIGKIKVTTTQLKKKQESTGIEDIFFLLLFSRCQRTSNGNTQAVSTMTSSLGFINYFISLIYPMVSA